MKGYTTTRYAYSPKRRVVWREICRWLNRRWIPASARILELGCGYGDFIGHISGTDKLAIEKDRNFSAYLNKLLDVKVLWDDALAALSRLPASSRDVVFASNFFEHFSLADVQRQLAEILRVLTPRGRLIVVQPNFKLCAADYFDDWTHCTVFSHVSFCDLLAVSGFEVARIEAKFLPFSLKSKWPVLPLLVRCYLSSPFKPGAAQFLVVAAKPSPGENRGT